MQRLRRVFASMSAESKNWLTRYTWRLSIFIKIKMPTFLNSRVEMKLSVKSSGGHLKEKKFIHAYFFSDWRGQEEPCTDAGSDWQATEQSQELQAPVWGGSKCSCIDFLSKLGATSCLLLDTLGSAGTSFPLSSSFPPHSSPVLLKLIQGKYHIYEMERYPL